MANPKAQLSKCLGGREQNNDTHGIEAPPCCHELIGGDFKIAPEIRPEEFRNNPPDLSYQQGLHECQSKKTVQKQPGPQKGCDGIERGCDNLNRNHFFSFEIRGISYFFGFSGKDEVKMAKAFLHPGTALVEGFAITTPKTYACQSPQPFPKGIGDADG